MHDRLFSCFPDFFYSVALSVFRLRNNTFWFSRKETFFKAVGLILFAYYVNMNNILAAMAELADARDLKSLGGNTVPVRPPVKAADLRWCKLRTAALFF